MIEPPPLLSALCVSVGLAGGPLFAQNIKITCEGSVLGVPVQPASPFQNVAAGDAFLFQFEVIDSPLVVTANHWLYDIDTSVGFVQVGAVMAALDPFYGASGAGVWNDDASFGDRLGFGTLVLGGMTQVSAMLEDPSAMMLHTPDLNDVVGGLGAPLPPAAQMSLGDMMGGVWVQASFSSFTVERDIGSSYCSPGALNSTGLPGFISAVGSQVVSDNRVILFADQIPRNAVGYFLTSQVQGLVQQPAGSQGVLCLGGLIGRYVGAGQIQSSGATGAFNLALDLTRHPTPTGLVTVNAGETWSFTTWHRDSVGGMATSNFTDGVAIRFR